MKGTSNTSINAESVVYDSSTVAAKLDSLSTSVADTVSKADGGTFNGNVTVDRGDPAGTTRSSIISAGNDKKDGTLGSSYGVVRIYSKTAGGYVNLRPLDSISAERTIRFPDADGTVALVDTSNTFTQNQVINRQDGTVSEPGFSNLFLGNNIPAGQDKNSRGQLVVYGPNGYYSALRADGVTDSNRSILMPNATGTIALTSDLPTDFVPASTGGRFSGKVTVNQGDTSSTAKESAMILGGNIADGNVGASYGVLGIYGKGTKMARIFANNITSTQRDFQLPDKGGTFALTSDLETSYTKLGSVEKASALNTTVSLPLSGSIDNYKYLWFCVSYYDSGVASYGGTMVQTKLAKLIYGQDAGIRVICLQGTTCGAVAFTITSTTSIQCVAEANIVGRYYVVYGLN